MAKFKFGVLVGDCKTTTAKLGTNTVANSGHLTNADIGKPVKLTAADTYALCADGDQIDGFLLTVEDYTADGYAVGTVQLDGRVRVEPDCASAVGTVVEAAAPAAARTAETNKLGKVSTHTIVTGTRKMWRVISGTGLSGDTTAIIEKQ